MSEKIDKVQVLERIKGYYDLKTNAKFASFLGIAPTTLSSWYSRSTFDLDVIYSKCAEISMDWLLTGEGSMLRNSKNPEETKWSSTPIATPISPAEESVIYKMYEKKDGENKVLIEELGGLKERLRSMEQELGALKSKYPHESPPGIVRENGEVLGSSETAKDAHSKRRTPASEPSYKHL